MKIKAQTIACLIVVTLSLALIVGCGLRSTNNNNATSTTGTAPASPGSASSTASPAEKPKETADPNVINIDAIEFYKEYKADWKKTDEKYRNKELAISGRVSSVKMDQSGGHIYLVAGGILDWVQCKFDDSQKENFSKLKEGQKVVIKGLYKELSIIPTVEHSKIVSAEEL